MSVFYKWGAGRDPGHPEIVDAYDSTLVTAEGEEILDAAAGAAVANLGHSPPDVADAMAEQAERVGYVSTSHFSVPSVESVGEKLASMTPDPLNAAFFVNSGSEAVESAIKLARDYHVARGEPTREAVIGRWASYHGSTLGALAASGNTGRRTTYDPLLRDWPKIGPAYPYRWDHEGSPEEQAIAAARELERLVRRRGPETVAAFIAEPVGGSSIPATRPHPAYYREIRRICSEYGLLFIADEVMVGFGRTGEPFACEGLGVTPDLMVLGKGLSAGYAPISAMMVADGVVETLEEHDHPFQHGHTYSGNPISAAVADRVLDRYTEDLFAAVRRRGRRLEETLEPLAEHPIVGEIRRVGLQVGVEFVADRETKAPFDPDADVADRIYDAALANGVYTYPGGGSVDGQAGDHLMLAPPLTVGDGDIETIGETVVSAVNRVADEEGY
ncbi:aminotransferase family protein [Halorubrum cibi]|uniref:Adenosylmethionine-8-amino-7-oxononanoate aminotransferase n=1 Tax=Halorubrum cibi TaxID=413815 RepID=A0A521AGD5_9EURY|nr:aminotransferase class III-fold pyridoxal phosphate-dependent enzyme [Halorubrum cibi]SMO33770.1 Adenosylmethionine-8-amino-7-oxononanoate aminotransferase [Halorubrum cibi]